MSSESFWMFSYGTLRQAAVQIRNFGRLLEGHADTLPGYALHAQNIVDPEVIALSGTSTHPIVRFTGRSGDAVAGVVFRVTADDLLKADAYEVSDYRRVSVTLNSGRTAFVYIASRPAE